MKKFEGFQKENGQIVKEAYFNGYGFGDTILEGVSFKATILKNGKMQITIPPISEPYMNTLNKNYWLKHAKNYAEQNDLFSENEDLTGEDLELLLF